MEDKKRIDELMAELNRDMGNGINSALSMGEDEAVVPMAIITLEHFIALHHREVEANQQISDNIAATLRAETRAAAWRFIAAGNAFMFACYCLGNNPSMRELMIMAVFGAAFLIAFVYWCRSDR